MKTKTIDELKKMDSLALTAVIEFWKDYDANTVLLAFGELKKRGEIIPGRLVKPVRTFLDNNAQPSLDAFLDQYLKENGYSSFEELFGKPVVKTDSESFRMQSISGSASDENRHKYPALRTVSAILKLFALIIAIISAIAAVIFIGNGEGNLLTGLLILASGLLVVLITVALAEAIVVLVDIEFNTRQSK